MAGAQSATNRPIGPPRPTSPGVGLGGGLKGLQSLIQHYGWRLKIPVSGVRLLSPAPGNTFYRKTLTVVLCGRRFVFLVSIFLQKQSVIIGKGLSLL